jgi:hypothetical protein
LGDQEQGGGYGKDGAGDPWRHLRRLAGAESRLDGDLSARRFNRAAVEVPIHYRHRESGAPFESTKANFWTLEDGWPVKLTEYHDIARVQAFVAAHAGAHPA